MARLHEGRRFEGGSSILTLASEVPLQGRAAEGWYPATTAAPDGDVSRSPRPAPGFNRCYRPLVPADALEP